MIVLDTNVVSELMKPEPDERVCLWLQHQPTLHLAITTITIGEIQFGIRRLPRGKRRERLEEDFAAFVSRGFEGRVLPYEEAAGFAYGDVAAERHRKGRRIDPVDLMIASIARTNQAAVATRNVRDFVDCGLKLVDPWQES